MLFSKINTFSDGFNLIVSFKYWRVNYFRYIFQLFMDKMSYCEVEVNYSVDEKINNILYYIPHIDLEQTCSLFYICIIIL